MNPSDKKIAIVASGGGMSCAYSVGVILSLVDNFKFTNPYIVIGSSGSTGTLAYYVAKQYSSIKNIWENLLSTKNFISYSRINMVVDVDYLIDVIFKKQDILNVEEIKQSKIKFFIAVTNFTNGNIEYFGNQTNIDIFEALRASNAIPIAYSKHVKINGGNFIDGSISASLEKNIEKAEKEGADIIIAIDNSKKNYMVQNILLKIYTLFKGSGIKKQVRNLCEELPYLNNNPKVILIKPTQNYPFKYSVITENIL